MDLSWSPEQQQLRDSVERWVAQSYPFETRRKLVASELGFSREKLEQFAELGWLGAALPEEVGGIGGNALETLIVMEAFGRGLVTEPYLPTVVLGANLITTPARRPKGRDPAGGRRGQVPARGRLRGADLALRAVQRHDQGRQARKRLRPVGSQMRRAQRRRGRPDHRLGAHRRSGARHRGQSACSCRSQGQACG